jgi:hypothetical protein
MVMGRRIDI